MSKMINLSAATFRYARTKVKLLFSPKYLLITNTAICGAFSGVGDMMQQFYEKIQERQDRWDFRRTAHLQLTGVALGPACHYWYLFLDRYFAGNSMRALCKKIVVDQVIFSPISIVLFFVCLGMLEGSTYKEIVKELIDKGKVLYVAEWVVWPPAQLINFYFLPTRFRVLYDNTVSLGFDYYYAYVKHRKDFKVQAYDEFRDMHTVTCSNAVSKHERLNKKKRTSAQVNTKGN